MDCLTLITALRESDDYIQSIFMEGSCYRFHLFLKRLYPSAEPYLHVDRDHIATRIDGKMYDIRGEIEPMFWGMYQPLRDEDLEMVQAWSFASNRLLLIGSCPVCDEPITA